MSETTKGRPQSGQRKAGSQSSAQRRRRERLEREQAMRRNSVLIIILTVVVILAIIGGVIVNMDKESKGSSVSSSESSSTVEIEENTDSLELNKYPEINALIANYRKAFLEGDTALLQEVYNTDETINADILTATSQIILSYNNTQYYTKKGINDGEYVVFVYDELELADIETWAPNLSVFYVMTANSGSYYIYRGEYNSSTTSYTYSEEVQSYIESLYEDSDVIELITTVNTKLNSACANDDDLMIFMEKVRSKASSTSSSSTTETEDETSDTTETSESA